MKIALVHDYLNEFGGAERVLLALSEIYPNAPIYTIYARKNSPAHKEFKNKHLIQSWFSYLPFSHKLISPLRFLIPLIWAQFNFKNYDLVITSASWAITKGMRRPKTTKEICYLHSPPRYLYGYDTSRAWQNKWFSGLVKAYALIVNHFMRPYDFKRAQSVDYFIVNSANVGKRVEKFYRRKDYQVIYPPVSLPKVLRSSPPVKKQHYYLAGGRLVAAKNFDLIIRACQKANVNLKLFGTGTEEKHLKKLAHSHPELDSGSKSTNIQFLGRVSDQELLNLYQHVHAFIVAQADEDFGITPIEAAAAGCPTIAYRGGGYLESVIENKTGVFFDELTVNSLVKAIKKSQKIKFQKSALTSHAQKFSKERFQKQIKSFINSHA
jgi:glycosyltransferase involved in cell wall biosynthesis